MKPSRLFLGLLFCVVAVSVCLPVGWAQEPPPSPEDPSIHNQLDRLNRNIERIAALLERNLEGQNLELLIQRVEMGSSRLAVAESNLSRAQATRKSIDTEKLELEARLGQIADEIDRGSLDMTVEDIERWTQELDLQLRLLKQQLRDADLVKCFAR